jgi:hypothetical protein
MSRTTSMNTCRNANTTARGLVRLTRLLVPLALLGLAPAVASAHVADGAAMTKASAGIYRNPGRLVGGDGGLSIRDGVMTGRLGGGAYKVRIEAGAARGSGPLGAIDVRITVTEGGHRVAGLWNGGRIDLVVSDHEVRGRAVRAMGADGRGLDSCRYDIGRTRDGSAYAGTVRCLAQGKVVRIEVQPRTRGDLADQQNVLLLVASLAAPGVLR